MTVDETLTKALLLFMQKGKGNGLEYVSRSHTADIGWYFWLEGVSGVYEIELKELAKDGSDANFYLRYYPDTEEEVLEDYSVAEQLLRFNEDFFNDNAITIGEEEHEICPCCTVPDMQDKHEHHEHHEHHGHCHCGEYVHRKVGIPVLAKKFDMNKKMFVIGTVHVCTSDTDSCKTNVSTEERLIERSEKGITFNRGGQEVELVAPGGVDRNVPGKYLCDRFMEFFNNKLLAVFG